MRRHHGLDSLAEDRGGQTGESFASIAQAGLVSTGRSLTKEGVRKIYGRGLAALQDYLAGRTQAMALPADDDEDYGPVRVPRSPWRPLPPPPVAPAAPVALAEPTVADAAEWEAFREAAAAVGAW